MNEGKKFENDWKRSIPKEAYFLRLKDSPASFGKDSKFVRFTGDNPYDFFCFYKYRFFPLELKHTKNKMFSIQREKTDKSKMIKLNQIKGLNEASNYNGVYAGFVFNFINKEKDDNRTYWLNIRDFNSFLEENNKKSINEKDIVYYGGIKITATKKIKNYVYEVKCLLDFLIEKEGK